MKQVFDFVKKTEAPSHRKLIKHKVKTQTI